MDNNIGRCDVSITTNKYMPRNVVRPMNDNNNINVLITRIMINIIDALEKYDNNRSIGLRFM